MATTKHRSYLSGDCDRSSLLELMRDGEHADNHDAVIEHLEHCAECRHEFDELAATQRDWETVREVLLTNDWSASSVPQTQRWNLNFDADRHAMSWNDQMAAQLLSPPSHPEMLGRIGRFEVERLIGSGGMGIVFKALDTELNRPVAIKLLAPYLAGNGPARKRFAREARAAAAIVHDHVVPIHSVEAEREVPYLVMQYIGGESLQARIDAQGALDVCEVLRIGTQVASGLAAAHHQGLVHRDIKPSNILLEPTVDRAFITDFGLARAADDASLTHTGFHPGTPQYMSPEQAAGESVDARSDLFSFGSVLYTMCTGRPPFRADTSLGVLRRIADSQPRPIQEINPRTPAWLCTLISRLMSKNPDDRFESAAQVAVLLEQCLAHVQQPSVNPLPQELRKNSRNGRAYFSRIFIGLGAIAASSLLWFAGTAIFLEFNKGTLRIESNSAANVPIRIKQGDKTVDELTVNNVGSNIQLQAGNYQIEIEGDRSNVEVVGDNVTIKRGDLWIAKIEVQKPASANARSSNAVETAASLWKLPDGQVDLTLTGAVKRFNEQHHNEMESLGCSPLTYNEIFTALNWKRSNDEMEPKVADALADVGYSDQIPVPWKLDGGVKVIGAGEDVVKVFQISLNNDFQSKQVLIRRQTISPPDRLLTPRELSSDPNSRPLQSAVDEFNAAYNEFHGERQSPLTVNEILAAIVHIVNQRRDSLTNGREDTSVDDATFEKLQRIATTHSLPADAKIKLETALGNYVGVWSILIEMPQVSPPEKNCGFCIRTQFIRYLGEVSNGETHWGATAKNGVQLGFRIYPIEKFEPVGNELKVKDGQKFKLDFFYRKENGEPVSATIPNEFYFVKLVITDVDGNKTEIGDQSNQINGGWRKEWFMKGFSRFPGKVIEIVSATKEKAERKSVIDDETISLVLAPNSTSKISFVAPNFGEYPDGALTTAEITLQMDSGLEGNQAVAPQQAEPANSEYTSLENLVRDFNQVHQRNYWFASESILTEDEVRSALNWKIEHGQFGADLKAAMQKLVWTRSLPIQWRLIGGMVDTQVGGDTTKVFEIKLEYDSALSPIVIRRNMISPPDRYREPRTERSWQPLDDVYEANSRPLSGAVLGFNDSNSHLNGKKQTELTVNEVLAAIADWGNRRNEADVDDQTFKNFQRIAETQRLPNDAKFELITNFGAQDGTTYYIWSIRILMPQVAKPGSTYAFTIRHQFVGMDSISLENIHWGMAGQNGLQAGFRLIPAQKSYREGQEIEVEFFYRSTTGKTIAASVPNVFYFDKLVTLQGTTGSSNFDHSQKLVGGWRQEHIGEQPTVFKGKRLIMLTRGPNPAPLKEDGTTAVALSEKMPAKIWFVVPNFGYESLEKLQTGEMEIKVLSDALPAMSGVGPTPVDTGLVSQQKDLNAEAFQANMKERRRRALEQTPALDSYQGSWQVTQMNEKNDDRLELFRDRKATLVIEGDHYQFDIRANYADDDLEHAFLATDFHLQGDQTPLHFDIVSDLFQVLPGIIEVDGDTIRMCYCCKQGATDADRPREFKPGADVFYVEAKRK